MFNNYMSNKKTYNDTYCIFYLIVTLLHTFYDIALLFTSFEVLDKDNKR